MEKVREICQSDDVGTMVLRFHHLRIKNIADKKRRSGQQS